MALLVVPNHLPGTERLYNKDTLHAYATSADIFYYKMVKKAKLNLHWLLPFYLLGFTD